LRYRIPAGFIISGVYPGNWGLYRIELLAHLAIVRPNLTESAIGKNVFGDSSSFYSHERYSSVEGLSMLMYPAIHVSQDTKGLWNSWKL
jgi:hypothetical protein